MKNGWQDLIYDTLEYIAKDDMGNTYPINANDVEIIYPKQEISKNYANKERTDR